MEDDKKHDGTTRSSDNVDNNAHYDKSGEPTREDFRNEKDSINDWFAEKNRSGRHR